MQRSKTIVALAAIALLLLGAATAEAASLQPIGSFKAPIYVSSDPGNPDRLFVVEREGKIEQVEGADVSLFADIGAAVGCGASPCTGERGLLSVAPAPDFDGSGRIYVDYAVNGSGDIHVAELRASGDTAPAGSLRNLLTIAHPVDDNHNGGQLQFGPDGYLYISTGDGGGKDDEHENAQNLSRLLGKILRIDPRQSGVLPYTVPAASPFAASPAPFNTIWSYGLRNPFRFSFDRLRGDLVIADVGQEKREEVDYAPAPGLGAGANYGWNCREGLIAGLATDPECKTPPGGGYVDPVFDYPHTDPGGGLAHGCAIIGGYVVRDRSLGDLYGRYLYGDYCTGEVRSLDLSDPAGSDRSEGLVVSKLSSFGEDSCGRLYTVAKEGQVARLVGAVPASCPKLVPPGSTQPPLTTSPPRPRLTSYLGLRAGSRLVPRGRRALITAWVSPCEGRRGEPVRLWRGAVDIGTRHLDRVCSVRFRPRIGQVSHFHATIKEDEGYLAANSRRLTVRPFQPKPR